MEVILKDRNAPLYSFEESQQIIIEKISDFKNYTDEIVQKLSTRQQKAD
jgi:hypothetical protein